MKSVEAKSDEQKVAEMVAWFSANYEPGGTTDFILNGMFDPVGMLSPPSSPARDPLVKQFPDYASALVDRAVQQIESGGVTRWAPTQYEWTPVEPPAGAQSGANNSANAEAQLRELQRRVTDLEVALSALRSANHGVIGHNNPPSDIFTPEDEREVQTALTVLKDVPANANALPQGFDQAAGKVRDVAFKIGRRLAADLQITVNAAEQTFLRSLAKSLESAALAQLS